MRDLATTILNRAARLRTAATLRFIRFAIAATLIPDEASLPDYNKQKRGIALEKQTDAEILAARKEFQQKMDQIAQRSDAQMQTGYARIEVGTQGAKTRIAEELNTEAS